MNQNENKDEKLKNLASSILSNQELPSEKFGSVIMIIMMIAILVNGIRVIQECNKSEKHDLDFYKNKIQEISIKKSWLNRIRLKKIIRRELCKEDYKLYGNSLSKAIFNKGEFITDEEISVLLEAIND